MRCPNCRTDIPEPSPRFRPFCSERCKMLDLGRWLDGSYRVEGEPASESEIGDELARASERSELD